jgi:hypothetical protein
MDSPRPRSQIVVEGHLAPWSDWGDDLQVETLAGGTTRLTGDIDQARLHGLFRVCRDRGVSIVSYHPMTQESPMDHRKRDPAQRRAEIGIAVLFLITAFASITGELLLAPLLASAETLTELSAHRMMAVAGAVLWSVNNLGIVFIAVFAYPLVALRGPLTALGYLVTRIIEGTVMMVGILAVLLLVFLSQTPEISSPGLVAALKQAKVLGISQISLPLLGLGGLLFVGHLWRYRMVPRVIAGTGLVGYALVLVGGLATWFGVLDASPGGPSSFLAVPVAVFEILLLPFWLFLRGFSSSSSQGVSE